VDFFKRVCGDSPHVHGSSQQHLKKHVVTSTLIEEFRRTLSDDHSAILGASNAKAGERIRYWIKRDAKQRTADAGLGEGGAAAPQAAPRRRRSPSLDPTGELIRSALRTERPGAKGGAGIAEGAPPTGGGGGDAAALRSGQSSQVRPMAISTLLSRRLAAAPRTTRFPFLFLASFAEHAPGIDKENSPGIDKEQRKLRCRCWSGASWT